MTRPRTATTDAEASGDAAAAAGSARPRWPVRSGLAVLLIAAAIAVNLAQFRSIDESTVDSFDAVHRNGTADIVELSYQECGWCRDRYGLHLALGILAPGSTVLVPASSRYAASPDAAGELTLRLSTYGRVDGVEWLGYAQPPQLLSTAGVPGSVVASGPGGAKGAPWALALAPPVPDGAGTADPDGFLERALAAGSHRRDGGPPPRVLVLLREQERDVLVDVALLPAAVRAELAR
ncbi:MAG: hypothetical protein ACRDT2_08295, partial [Natronosporangium sp.]